MPRNLWKFWGASGLSACLLELPFPLAGPLPVWRSMFAWFGLVPLLWAILSPEREGCVRPLRRAFLVSYLCGFLWYMGNCYWARDTMSRYGDMPPLSPTLLLIGFGLRLRLCFCVRGLGAMQVPPPPGSTSVSLPVAPSLLSSPDPPAAR